LVKTIHTFHDAIVATGDGTTLKLNFDMSPEAVLVFAITGTATARTVDFKALDTNGKYTDLLCTNLKAGTTAVKSTATTDDVWKVAVAGLAGVQCVVSAVSGGNLTVTGKLVI